MSDFSENNDFDNILQRLLDNIDEDIDTRQGSIIYDALAPAAAELAQCYIALDVFIDQTYLLNAVGENLDNRAYDYGIERIQATYSQRVIEIHDINGELMDVDIGTRFAVPNEYGGYIYEIIEKISTGKFIAQCETAGSNGDLYSGELLPLISINNLGDVNLTTIYKPAEDEETDEELRNRVLTKINSESFGGNKASYMEFTKNIDGVTKCKIFPVWDGGGTVKVAVLSTNNSIPSQTFIDAVQQIIDPVSTPGQGLGIAPIGHTVTVVAPTRLDINITANITPITGYTVEQLQSDIESQINNYIQEVQNNWENNDNLIIYQSKLIAAILEVSQVQNVTNLKINDVNNDLTINITANNVLFPILNGVILNEN